MDGGSLSRSPDGIRTRATALRGRRARPLHNGALAGCPALRSARAAERTLPAGRNFSESASGRKSRGPELGYQDSNLELTEPESVVLPITPYPKGVSLPARPQGRDRRVNRGAILPAPRDALPNRLLPSRRSSSSWRRRRRVSVEVLPRISIDSNSGGEMRWPETAVRSGPKANLGLMPSPSTIAARRAASMAAAFQPLSEPSTPVPVSSMSSSTLEGGVEHLAGVVLELGAGVVGDLERRRRRRRTGATRAVASVSRRHPRLDQLGDRLEPGQLAERLGCRRGTPSALEVGQQPAWRARRPRASRM